MAIDRKTGRIAPAWGGLVALLITPALASAQDRPATGPSTAEPETNKNSPQNPLYGAKAPMPKSPDQVLPGVPATASDPAPPGTRSVRVDLKPATPATSAARPMASTMTVEGMVTGLSRKGGDLKNETLRISVDPTRGWETYVAGPSPAPAGTPPAGVAGTTPKAIDLILTGRTYTFAHARTADGVDLIGAATESSPDDARLRSDELGSHMTLRRTSDPETSWTNIKEGSYVIVRYRKAGELNQAINVSLIQLPLNPNAASVPGAIAPAPGTTTGKAATIPETKLPTSPGAIP